MAHGREQKQHTNRHNYSSPALYNIKVYEMSKQLVKKYMDQLESL